MPVSPGNVFTMMMSVVSHALFEQPVEPPLVINECWLNSALVSQKFAVCSADLIRHRLDTGHFPGHNQGRVCVLRELMSMGGSQICIERHDRVGSSRKAGSPAEELVDLKHSAQMVCLVWLLLAGTSELQLPYKSVLMVQSWYK